MIDDTIPCIITSNSSSYIVCQSLFIGGSIHKVSVINSQNSIDLSFTMMYPLVTAFDYDRNDTRNIILYGEFGSNGQTNPAVYLNETVYCQVTYASQSLLNCKLANPPSFGNASVSVIIDSFIFNRTNALNFVNNNNNNNTSGGSSSNISPIEQCEQSTFKCYGHGECDSFGNCQCYPNYDQLDNCKNMYTNTTPIIDPKKPTTSFNIDGIEFDFEIISIQELDLEENIVKELLADNWNSNITITPSITIANYQLNITNNNDTTTTTTTNMMSHYGNTSVSATISFSSQARTVTFGSQQLDINPNAIKLAVNISGWHFDTNLSYLRVVFQTSSINNTQSYTYDCNDYRLDPLSFDEYGTTLQYLRVVKDNVQFNGRFIDYSVADGRPTYSRTKLISLTPNTKAALDNTSSALIGVYLSQCQECLLDPDFTPLLIDKGDTRCGSDQSNNTWRIIVGAVVGGIGMVAVAIGSALLIQKKKIYNRNIKALQAKMKAFE
ncbi:hypothetical protein DFA_09586 [Cavenderia fasciculata]|uniref:ComC supersandwich domain-containing protein n=1 Tax=Cavenderia fasciculata TaxID=261658 RepID=F4Q815_CACFS|nr:uncharacterized protein DFA_09586 [Cavenderia fasciculata]EGG15915.1 hypothetical protein DFA_09586 [Cavenderia fasciculata]|eukprot:XP_004352240.1 hypothetical protein DFA_09586 [Cavenderia fasciculata]